MNVQVETLERRLRMLEVKIERLEKEIRHINSGIEKKVICLNLQKVKVVFLKIKLTPFYLLSVSMLSQLTARITHGPRLISFSNAYQCIRQPTVL